MTPEHRMSAEPDQPAEPQDHEAEDGAGAAHRAEADLGADDRSQADADLPDADRRTGRERRAGAVHRSPAPVDDEPQVAAPLGRSWRTVGRALAPRLTRAQLMAGFLSALVGFALVVQVQQNQAGGLSTLRQEELVRILDDVTQRSEELEDQAAELRAQRAELVTGTDTQRAAREAAAARAESQGILAGRLPAEGPGIELVIREPEDRISALNLFNVLEELRNAGAEAIQLGDLRMTASTYFIDTPDGVEVDGTVLRAPYRWVAIGDPETIATALRMPGGALAQVRGEGGTSDLETRDLVEVTAVREVEPPTFATPVPAPEGE